VTFAAWWPYERRRERPLLWRDAADGGSGHFAAFAGDYRHKGDLATNILASQASGELPPCSRVSVAAFLGEIALLFAAATSDASPPVRGGLYAPLVGGILEDVRPSKRRRRTLSARVASALWAPCAGVFVWAALVPGGFAFRLRLPSVRRGWRGAGANSPA
jgi:hypothetical protein